MPRVVLVESMKEKNFISLSADQIKQNLPEELRSSDIIVYQSVDSTNARAVAMGREGAGHGTVLLAEEQTEGRGRNGRSFFSQVGTGLYMSIILRAGQFDPQLLTIKAAVAVCRAIESVTGISPQIKWVNDLYLGGRKICGILAEAVASPLSGNIDFAVLGIGINCSTESFPAELSEKAGSLSATDFSRNVLAAEIIRNLTDTSLPGGQDLISEYKSRSLMPGKRVEYSMNGHRYSADVLDFSPDGGLVVRTSDGEIQTLSSGEVSVKGAV